MYSIQGYGNMIADEIRTDAYAAALRQAIRPGSVVLDIGTGTGFFALLACRYGARRVYAVEPGDAINVARSIAAANGCGETIEFIQAMSTEVSLREPADVIVSDLHGVLPYYGRHISSIIDARQRLLAPGGVLIPCRDSLWLACVEVPDLHREITVPWSENRYGLDMRAASDLQANRWRRAKVKPEQLITQAVKCASIDFYTIENCKLDTTARVSASRAGSAHGFCVWFDSVLIEGIQLSNSPEQPELIYGQAFFPWPEPIRIGIGDTIDVRLRSDPVGDDYLWSWETRVFRQGAGQVPEVHFRQSDFFAEPLSIGRLHKQAADHIPALNRDGQIDRLILDMMRDTSTLGDIASRLVDVFPDRFSRWQDALTRVAMLSDRYSGGR